MNENYIQDYAQLTNLNTFGNSDPNGTYILHKSL
jgi:hypothetical protein